MGSSELDKNLASELAQMLPQSSYKLISGVFVDGIEKGFPFSGSKINWSKTRQHVHKEAEKSNLGWEACHFFQCICFNTDLGQSCIYLNDSCLESIFEIDVTALAKCLPCIVEYPGHHYFFGKSDIWCFAVTMEGDLDFAFAPVP